MLPDFSSLESGVMVEVDGERENVLARGPRCVSLSSKRTDYLALVHTDINGWCCICQVRCLRRVSQRRAGGHPSKVPRYFGSIMMELDSLLVRKRDILMFAGEVGGGRI